jgi:hypothetical protein
MSARVIRCTRCRKRWRGPGSRNADRWNVDLIAGLIVGHLCPDCQTTEEDLGAEVNLVLSPPSPRGLDVTAEGGVARLVDGLTRTYPTAEIMRAKAGQLVAARRDEQASEMARLMRRLAEAMETGELWEEADSDE